MTRQYSTRNHGRKRAVLLFPALFLLTVGNAHAQGSVAEDRAALVALYNATDGDNWTNNTNWASQEPLSEWSGVATDANGRVTELTLHNNQLSGEIPAELGDLTNLQELGLSQNNLSGEIPAGVGALTNLQNLLLQDNRLSEEIPAELGDLTNLQKLWLNDNTLSGPIPAELGDLANLQNLLLQDNMLSEEIPEELGDLAELQLLTLYQNQLSGEIPEELGNLAELQRLTLSSNELTGEIPVELGNLANLQRLYLHDNELSGENLSWLVNLTGLTELSLWSNQLIGTIPAELAPAQDRAALVVLYGATDGANWTDSTNWRSGEPLSEWHGVSTDAQGRVDELRLSANGLTGTIGAELGVLTHLQRLYLNGNNGLTGTIPPELENLVNLQVFDVRNTGLSCVTPGSQLHTWLMTINSQGAVCATTAGPPRVTSVVVASAPQSGDTYRLYETILFTVTFSEPVEFKPQGRLRLEVGLDNPGGASGSTVEAVFSRITRSQYPTDDTPQISRTRHMHFEYKVQLFDRDADGVRIRANALRLASGARIRSEGGRDAELDHAAVGPRSDRGRTTRSTGRRTYR